MQHLERCTIWKKPKDPANWENSISDAFAAMSPEMMLVYRMNRPGDGASVTLNGKRRENYDNLLASEVASRHGGALVQWPEETSNGNKNKVRKWLYAIQKTGKAVRS